MKAKCKEPIENVKRILFEIATARREVERVKDIQSEIDAQVILVAKLQAESDQATARLMKPLAHYHKSHKGRGYTYDNPLAIDAERATRHLAYAKTALFNLEYIQENNAKSPREHLAHYQAALSGAAKELAAAAANAAIEGAMTIRRERKRPPRKVKPVKPDKIDLPVIPLPPPHLGVYIVAAQDWLKAIKALEFRDLIGLPDHEGLGVKASVLKEWLKLVESSAVILTLSKSATLTLTIPGGRTKAEFRPSPYTGKQHIALINFTPIVNS